MDTATPRRQTRQRRLVYEAVASTDTHPTAEWVFERVRRRLPRVSLGTVYRNLQLLVTEGRLKAWTRGRTTRYDAGVMPHDHFVCQVCGRKFVSLSAHITRIHGLSRLEYKAEFGPAPLFARALRQRLSRARGALGAALEGAGR